MYSVAKRSKVWYNAYTMKMLTTHFTITSPALPPAFDGFAIAHVSDLHNRDFGTRLLSAVKAVRPDIVVVTGDSIHKEGQTAAAQTFLTAATDVAPVYYVTGNHEKVLACYPAFADTLRASGVRVLANEYEVISRDGNNIAILGMNDPAFFAGGKQEFCDALERLHAEISAQGIAYTVLLSHRPEMFEKYVGQKINLSLCGHAHGGHVRLPLIGALYAPNQGLFPKYTEGVYVRDGYAMAVSKGLGKSSWVPRTFNPPELCVEVLRTVKDGAPEEEKSETANNKGGCP